MLSLLKFIQSVSVCMPNNLGNWQDQIRINANIAAWSCIWDSLALCWDSAAHFFNSSFCTSMHCCCFLCSALSLSRLSFLASVCALISILCFKCSEVLPKMWIISDGELLTCCFLSLLGSTSTSFEHFISCLSTAVRFSREAFLRASALALSSFFFAAVWEDVTLLSFSKLVTVS